MSKTYWLFKQTNNTYKTYAGILISFFLLWLTIRQSHISYRSLLLNLYQVKMLGLGIMVFIITVMVQAQRTKFIWIKKLKDFFKIRAYSSIILGNFYNCLLPGNLGEGVRAWHFARRNHVSFSNSIGAILIEKLIDAQLFVTIIILVNIIHPPSMADTMIVILDIAGGIILAADIFLLILLFSRRSGKVLWAMIPVRILRKKLFQLFIHMKHHIDRMDKSGWIWMYIPLGYVMFVLNILQYGLLLKAVGVGPPILGLYSLVIVSCCMIIVLFIPSAPSNIGVVHYGVYIALCNAAAILGVQANIPMQQKFAAMAVLLHISYLLPEIILGIFFLLKERKWLL